MIYAQRPDATACASMELWNGTMRRWVKPGSKGIAIIRKDRRGKPSLEYVFDVADTRPVRGAREPYLWRMGEEHHPAVLDALKQRYGPITDVDLGGWIMEAAIHAADEVYRERLNDLANDTKGSRLEELDDLNLEIRFSSLMIGKQGKAGLLILRPAIGVSDANTGKNPGFVNIQSAAVFAENFKGH